MTESFAELFEQSQSIAKLRSGAIVSGIVVEIRSDVVVVNAGLKSEGIIPIEQFKNERGELEINVGDEVKVALDAIARAGRKDREAIRAAVFATADYDGILGTWSFDANGDTSLTTMTGRRVVNGTFDEEHAVLLEAK